MFVREERYIVIKRKYLTKAQERELRALIKTFDLPPLQCAVIESDWPEYDEVWGMIEERVAREALFNKPNPVRRRKYRERP